MARNIQDALAGFELPILKHGTTQRVIYAEAMTGGSTVIEAQPYGDATFEMKKIMRELRA